MIKTFVLQFCDSGRVSRRRSCESHDDLAKIIIMIIMTATHDFCLSRFGRDTIGIASFVSYQSRLSLRNILVFE
jgi:hypothetical protein